MWIAFLLLACQTDKSGLASDDTDATAESDSPIDTEPPADSGAPPVDRATAVCERWRTGRADLREATWTGNALACSAGSMPADAKQRVLAVLNTWRFLVDQPEVTNDPALDAAAQQCALMQHANHTLNHYPPDTWRCWTADGAAAAGRSNLATSPAVTALDMYMQDWGNEQTLGHRRWLLSRSLGPVGIGGTSEFSCLDVGSGTGRSDHRWAAWPAPGPVPIQAIEAGGSLSTDETGWSVQSDDIDLTGATATVHDGDAELPVNVTALLEGYGSRWAIKIRPAGWRSAVGHHYDVAVTGGAEPIRYTVDVIDCD
ncbi:MAG TPA: CAP domain-containing protein [Myxococcota bacterium]|nr:CAP domain-containing protein [Myxococcota bacterium]